MTMKVKKQQICFGASRFLSLAFNCIFLGIVLNRES